MNSNVERRLRELKRDYESTEHRSWKHFFCPVLYRDEESELCRGHIINEAFKDADRSWTIQRSDVDGYYGSKFEADFLALEKIGAPIAEDALADKNLARQFRPEILLDGEVKEHYYAPDRRSVPPEHTPLDFYVNGEIVPLAMKLSPEETERRLEGRWEIQVEKDIRIAALVSLLKCAHLTLFHRLGYRYVFSSGGHHLGREVLGDFYLKNHTLAKSDAVEAAESYFRSYAGAVRPVLSASPDLRGTLTDGQFFACVSGSTPWGIIVLIEFSGQMHAVIVPTLSDADTAALYWNFLKSPFPKIEVRVGRIHDDRLEVSPKPQTMEWPETLFD